MIVRLYHQLPHCNLRINYIKYYSSKEFLKNMKRAAIYARYSSHKQREESIEEQIDECKEYAEQNDLQIVKVYTDSAVSGKTEDRDGWQEMMQNAKLKMFDVLLVYTIDRMGRDRYALAVAKKALKDCGVTVIPIKQPMVDGPENILLDSLMEGLAEYYNADLARKVNRGMNDNAQKCLANGSKPPIGYIVDPVTKNMSLMRKVLRLSGLFLCLSFTVFPLKIL